VVLPALVQFDANSIPAQSITVRIAACGTSILRNLERRLSARNLWPSVLRAAPARDELNTKSHSASSLSSFNSSPASILRYAAVHPYSRFGTSIRSLKVVADLKLGAEQGVVIGVVSAIPMEGSSTVASNLAFLMNAYAPTLLVETEVRGQILALTDQLNKSRHPRQLDFDRSDTETKITAPTRVSLSTSGTHRSAPQLAYAAATLSAIIQDAKKKYKYIVVDLPPLLAAPEAQAACPGIDGFVLVIRCGGASRQAVVEALTQAPEVSGKLIGAVLNQTAEGALRRNESYKGIAFRRYFY
jgi:polysaccharide biosynthesis transport protein